MTSPPNLSWRAPLLAIPIALVIGIGMYACQGDVHFQQRGAAMDRTYRLLMTGSDVLSRLRDAESAQRGFLLTGRASYLVTYRSALGDVNQDLADLSGPSDSLPNGPDLARHLSILVQFKTAEMAESIELYRTGGQRAALPLVETDRGRDWMRQIRASSDELVREASGKLAAEREAGRAYSARAGLFVGGGSAVLLVLILVATAVLQMETRRGHLDAQRIAELNQTLEQRVRERTRALQESNDELEAFCYSVSHDLRAPLRSMEGFGRILTREYAGRTLDARGVDLLHRIGASAVRMGQIVEDLLNLSRISRGPVRANHIDLSAMAASVVRELEIRDPGRQVDVRIEPDIGAFGDAWLVRIVLENLLGNAWKFTRKTVDARIEFGQISGAKTVFYVGDNGAGFDMTQAAQLFVPFHRLHPVTEFEGSGIGLATVQRVVHRHGGKIWAESAPGNGATFHFTLDSEETDRQTPQQKVEHQVAHA